MTETIKSLGLYAIALKNTKESYLKQLEQSNLEQDNITRIWDAAFVLDYMIALNAKYIKLLNFIKNHQDILKIDDKLTNPTDFQKFFNGLEQVIENKPLLEQLNKSNQNLKKRMLYTMVAAITASILMFLLIFLPIILLPPSAIPTILLILTLMLESSILLMLKYYVEHKMNEMDKEQEDIESLTPESADEKHHYKEDYTYKSKLGNGNDLEQTTIYHYDSSKESKSLRDSFFTNKTNQDKTLSIEVQEEFIRLHNTNP